MRRNIICLFARNRKGRLIQQMKIDSKKLMIALLIITALILTALLIYGGFALGDDGGEESTAAPTDSTFAPDTSHTQSTANSTTTTDPIGNETATPVSSGNETTAPEPQGTTYQARSGRVIADEAALLSLLIDWETVSRTADTAEVKLTLKVRSYSLFVSERYNCPFKFLGQAYTYTAPAIAYEGTDRTEFAIYETTVTMPLVGGCGSAEVSASWPFRGVYAGANIDELSINGFIEIKD